MKKMLKAMLGVLLTAVLALGLVACNANQSEAKLKAIAVTTKPNKTEYVSGEMFDPTGMVVTAAYDNDTTKAVTGYTWDKKGALTEEDTSVKISYKEGTVTKNTSLSITVIPAIDHIRYHEFGDNGLCSCGALKFEAEDAALEGAPANSADSFIVQSAEASGGACVGNWQDGDNRWTTYLTLENAVDEAIVGIRFAPTNVANGHTLPVTAAQADRNAKGSTMWAWEMRVNGGIVSWQSGDVPSYDGQSYFNWKTFLTNPVSLQAGENTINLEPWDFYGMNIDYIFVQLPAGANASFSKDPATPPVPEHVHEFVEGKCTCGAVKIEAEDCTVTGTPAAWVGTTDTSVFYRDIDSADPSLGRKVGVWGEHADNKIYIRFTSDKAYENANLLFRVNAAEYLSDPNGYELYFLDAADAKITHDVVGGGGGWKNNRTSSFNLKQGENVLVVSALAGNNQIDWDYFVLEGLPADAQIVATPYVVPQDPTPPVPEHVHEFVEGKCTCGAVKIEAEDCTVTGTPADWAGSDGFYRSHGDGMKVGAWGVNGDNKIYIRFTSDKAYDDLSMTFCVQTAGIIVADGFLFYAYDEANATKGAAISHPTISGGISAWTEISSGKFSVAAGENVFVIEAYQACEVDWDYFILEGLPSDASITVSTRTS